MVWRCANRVEHGNKICKSSSTITEEVAVRFVCDALGTSQLDHEAIREGLYSITVESDGILTLDFQQSELDKMVMG